MHSPLGGPAMGIRPFRARLREAVAALDTRSGASLELAMVAGGGGARGPG
jgi:hypothetical protein